MPEPTTGGTSSARTTIANRYHLLQRAGEGALFIVYRAQDSETGAMVAVKMLRPSLTANAAFASRMEAEARAAMSLYNRHIAHILDVVREDGALYIVTEFVSGMSLQERILRTAPLPVAVAVDIAAEVAEALSAAHARGIVHGDVRPHNVLIGGDGHVKVTDFGLARSLEASPDLEMNSILRWVQCMAPEVGSGEVATPASDTYSLGCMLYHMLTGAPLFPGENAIVVALKHAKDTPRSVRTVNPSLPPALDAVVTRAVQKTPGDRYPDGSAMLADLRQIQDALRENKPLDWTPTHTLRPTTAPPPPPVETYVEEDEVPRYLTFIRNFLLIVIGIGIVYGGYLIYGVFQPQSDVVIPELMGLTRAEAQQMLTDKGLLANVQSRESARPADEVIQQDPPPGETVKPGRVVRITVSKGPRMTTVPAVTEMSLDRARELAEQAGLKVAKSDSRHDEVVQEGYVLEQNPGPGEKVKPGKTIQLIVSLGPEPPPPPPPVVEPPPIDTYPGVTPPADPSLTPTTPSQRTGRLRSFNLRFQVPTEGYEQPVEVQIVVLDERGERIVVDEQHTLGQVVTKRVDAVGERVLLRVYMNGILFSEETR